MARTGYRKGDTDGDNRPFRGNKVRRTAHRNAEFSGWVNINIPETSRAAFTEFEGSTAFVDALDIIGKHNIRLFLIQEEGTDGFMASAFKMDETRDDGGLMVSQRSGNSLRALAKLAFCIVELMPDDWTELVTQGRADW